MIRVVRLGTPRMKDEGLRLGTVRRPPRGVPKAEFATRDFYDVWMPELAPTADVVTQGLSQPWTEASWRRFASTYQRQMREPHAQHLVALLAALSHRTNLSVGCYCEDASRCHRTLLQELLRDAGALVD
jgi:uncharacterized protein YeaO (DUF488 family)